MLAKKRARGMKRRLSFNTPVTRLFFIYNLYIIMQTLGRRKTFLSKAKWYIIVYRVSTAAILRRKKLRWPKCLNVRR